MADSILVLISLLLFVSVMLNGIATYIVFNTYFEVKKRRLYQILFIWLLPFFGAALCIYINREDYFAQKKKKIIGNHTNITHNESLKHSRGADHHGGR